MKDQVVKELTTLRQQVAELELEGNQMVTLFRTLADKSTVGVYIVQDGVFRFVNSVFLNYVGYSAEELLSVNSLHLVYPKDRDKVRRNAVKMLKGKRRLPYEFRYMSKSGETKWVTEAVVSITYQGKQAALGSFMDITERKRIEEELKKSEKFYRTIIETAVDGYCCTDMEGRFLDVNDSYCLMVGYSREELLGGMSISDVDDIETPEDVAKRIKQILEHEYERFETRHRRKDGQVIDIEVSVRYIDLNGGQLIIFFRDITDVKQAEETLQRNQEHFQAIVENAFDTIMVINADARVRYVSPSIKKILGYEPGEWIGKYLFDFLHPDEMEEMLDRYNKETKDPSYVGHIEISELRAKHKNGSWRTIESISTNLLHDPSVAGIVSNFHDITERKETEEALHDSKEYFQALIENSFDTNMIINADGSIGYISPSLIRTLGYLPEEWIGKSLFDFTHPDDLQKVIDLLKEELDIPDYNAFMELRAKHKDGSWRTIEGVSTNLLYHPSIAGIVANFRDITDRKNIEEKYRKLLEDMKDGYAVLQDGNIVFANKRFCEVFGYEPGQVLGHNMIEFIAPEDIQEVMELYTKVMEDVEELPERLELAGIKGDGTIFPIDGDIRQIEYEGKPAYSIIVRDITEQKRANEELQALYEGETRLRQQLEVEKERRAEFNRVLVHELNTPLTAVISSSEVLVNELKEGTLRRLANNINRGAINLSNRIYDLLDLSRGDIGALNLYFESVDLLAMIRRVADYVDPVASRCNQSLVLDLPQSLPQVRADENRLQQVMLNILNNAFKFTPNGGIITIKAVRKDSALIVEVQDSGQGITEERGERIFQPYNRVESDRQILNGLGLGLALCKTLVELHGGHIWMKSCPGEGSTFSFSLPLEE